MQQQFYPKPAVNCVTEESPQQPGNDPATPLFSPEHYYQIQQMIQRGSMEPDIPTTASLTTVNNVDLSHNASGSNTASNPTPIPSSMPLPEASIPLPPGNLIRHSHIIKVAPKWFIDYVGKGELNLFILLLISIKDSFYEFDIATGNDNDKLIGRLLYLTMTRPDIAYAVQLLSQFMHKPKESHMLAALRVIRYIKNSPGLGMLMSSASSHSLTAYCDSDWEACP
uniref:Reverse transcriptase Ty1/copia-type domain-containing protein n=1 Tax=Solanum lycopersicum TaxID=4081 RepID=A0A3Q7GAZ3_SOLLC